MIQPAMATRRARYSALRRYRPADDPLVIDAWEALRFQVLLEHWTSVAESMQLSASQLQQLRDVLTGVGEPKVA